MSNTLQNFLVEATQTAATNLETALLRLPEDKRNWSSMGDARTPMDMVAECAILGDPTEIVQTRSFPMDFDFVAFGAQKTALARDWEATRALLLKNVDRAVTTIQSIPDEDLGIEVEMPWGKFTIGQIISYPYWNMSYHEAQINYIASMIGCLE
jgi:hypothetical protein